MIRAIPARTSGLAWRMLKIKKSYTYTVMPNYITLAWLCFSGWRVANVGGNSNNGTQDGAFYLNLNNDSGNSNTNIGSRRCPQVFSEPYRAGHTSW
jgi:hypothetical protein